MSILCLLHAREVADVGTAAVGAPVWCGRRTVGAWQAAGKRAALGKQWRKRLADAGGGWRCSPRRLMVKLRFIVIDTET